MGTTFRLARASLALGIAVALVATTAALGRGRAAERAQLPDPSAVEVAFEEVVGGFARPVGVTNAGDGSGRLFVIEKVGRIRIVQGGALVEVPFLDIADHVESAANERGLLGLAFHPEYAQNGVFYVNYTTSRTTGGLSVGDTVIARFNVSDDPDVADRDSEHEVLTYDQPYQNHNGGHLAFGPDGYLYIGAGDGGAGDDPQGRAQDLGQLLGKMLRIDVATEGDATYTIPDDNPFRDQPGARDEIWAVGLRNPWRYAFDSSGDLYIGDVGQNAWEEIDFQPADSTGGQNYGWKIMEGTHCRNPRPTCTAPEGHVPPIFEHDRDDAKSITGGEVYRGARFPELDGIYIYADYVTGFVWGGARDAEGAWQNARIGDAGFLLSSFGLDEAGEIYAVNDNPGTDQPTGRLFRLVAQGAPTEPVPTAPVPTEPTPTDEPPGTEPTPTEPPATTSPTPTERIFIPPSETPTATPTIFDGPWPQIFLPVGFAGT